MPQTLSDDEYDFLYKALVYERADLAFRPEKSSKRDRLRRLGLIQSRTPPGWRFHARKGDSYFWNLTDAGRLRLDPMIPEIERRIDEENKRYLVAAKLSLGRVLDAWDAMPAGRCHAPVGVVSWWHDTMIPAIEAARDTLGRKPAST